MTKRKYTQDQLKEAVKTSTSMAELLRKLDYSTNATNYIKFNKLIKEYGFDNSHWLGNGSNKGKTLSNKAMPLSEILVENSPYKDAGGIKNKLIKNKLLPYNCSICGISSWLNSHLVLQLDHINGISNDNRIENLRLLCPNCHSQTETYCGKNAKKYPSKEEYLEECKKKRHSTKCPEPGCTNDMDNRSKCCKECSDKKHLSKTKIKWPEINQLRLMIEDRNMWQVAKQLGVSNTALKKRIEKHSIT